MNSTPHQPPAEDDARMLRAVQEYLAELEAGRRPDRQAFAARFPDLSGQMAPYLDALDAVHGASPLLAQRSGSRPVAIAEEPLPAEPLGDFSIVREIGRGGMGVVYEAVQLSLGRRVALKVLPLAATLDPRQLQRFQNEARAAASLHHPNIVPVYAVGCERSVHYYAMQLIEGQSLAALVEDLRRVEAPPAMEGAHVAPGVEPTGPYFPPSPPLPGSGGEGSRTMPADTQAILASQYSTQRSRRPLDFVRNIARLIAQAAEGLDYAHGLGIVHRDVKPANLLLDNRGNVWITDFGLAQFHANAGLSHTGDLVGTLRYMSPEQAGGQRALVDHRTDVYSLGATLYELLTLRPIFDGTDRQKLLHQILHDEPRPPRSVDPSIPPELETIVLKAVGKTPTERYATARDFADDLQRFLRDEPILARRQTRIQLARKWLRRHPSVPVASVVVLVLLAVGSLVAAWLVRGAYERERLRAEEAEAQFQLAKQSVDEMILMAQEELVGKPHVEGLRKRMLEAALSYYQQFIELRRDDPAAQKELERTRDQVKGIVDDLAVLQGAGQLRLLKHEWILAELDLSAEQKKQMIAFTQRTPDRRLVTVARFHELAPQERELSFLTLAREEYDSVRQVLSTEQLGRLRQIALQLQGLRAFRDPDVVAALALTQEQKQRFQALEAVEAACEPGDGPVPPPKPRQDLNAVAEKIKNELTAEQWRRWQEMIGTPYTGPPVPVGPPGPFGFHPRGGDKGPGHFGKDKGFGPPGKGPLDRRPPQ
ncbi:MAG TPA: serine/threonine-protein kinase [Gemmataceae bacterium]|nr:serine/threonine-protein kinase [Gemmataceae bacterium]